MLLLCLVLVTGCGKPSTNTVIPPSTQEKPQSLAPLAPTNGAENTQSKKGSGRFQGQIDSNSIEIKVSGVPDNIAPRAFQLAEPLKENFEKYGLKKDDQVLFTYTEKTGEQPVITEINKIK